MSHPLFRARRRVRICHQEGTQARLTLSMSIAMAAISASPRSVVKAAALLLLERRHDDTHPSIIRLPPSCVLATAARQLCRGAGFEEVEPRHALRPSSLDADGASRLRPAAVIRPKLSDLVSRRLAYALDPLTLIIGLSIVYLILGCFLDPLGLMLLTLPVFMPMFAALKLDMIWVGVIVIKYIEIGLITPPVGLNVYVVKGVVGDRVALTTIFKGVMWFIAVEAIIMTLLIAFLSISTWLPAKLN